MLPELSIFQGKAISANFYVKCYDVQELTAICDFVTSALGSSQYLMVIYVNWDLRQRTYVV